MVPIIFYKSCFPLNLRDGKWLPTRKLPNHRYSSKAEVLISIVVRLPSWLSWPSRVICVTNDLVDLHVDLCHKVLRWPSRKICHKWLPWPSRKICHRLLLWPSRKISVTNRQGHICLSLSKSRPSFHVHDVSPNMTWHRIIIWLKRMVSLLEQELLTSYETREFVICFSEIRVVQPFIFLAVFFWPLFCYCFR